MTELKTVKEVLVAWRENRLSFRDGLTRLGQLGLSVEQAAQLLVKT